MPSRDALYRKVANHALEAIDTIVGEMKAPTKMASVKIGAAKVILNKALPDLKATELTGKDGAAFTVQLIKQWLHTPRENPVDVPPSSGSSERQDKVQGADMAPQGKKDVNSTGKSGDGGV